MDHSEQTIVVQDAAAALAHLTPLERQLLACRSELATTLRAIQGVAGLMANNVETGGSVMDLGALYTSLGLLGRQADGQAERFAALVSSEGSA
jgi:hypothetical protein